MSLLVKAGKLIFIEKLRGYSENYLYIQTVKSCFVE